MPTPTDLLIKKACELRDNAHRYPGSVAIHAARQLLRLARCQRRLARPLTNPEAERILTRDLQPYEL